MKRETFEHNNPATYKRRLTDRKDGRLLRTLEPIDYCVPFLFPTRIGSQNYFSESIDYEAIKTYCAKKREEGLKGFGAMHVLVATFVRTISQHPEMNRFISGRRIYARNDVEVSLMVKKALTREAPETSLKFNFDRNCTSEDVYNIMTAQIEEYQNAPDQEASNAVDKLLKSVFLLPRFVLEFLVGLIHFLDYFGKLPKSIMELSPFHSSMFFTSMGSLGINTIYHHLYDIGNIPLFIAFSAIRKGNVLQKDGSVKRVRYLDVNITVEERICNGYYLASCVQDVLRYLKKPELLDTPPETIYFDRD